MTDKYPDYPADGSDSLIPTPSDIAALTEEERATALAGLAEARRALNRDTDTTEVDEVKPNVESTEQHDDYNQPAEPTGVLGGLVKVESSEPAEQKAVQPRLFGDEREESESDAKAKSKKVRPPKVAFGGFVKSEIYDLFGDHDLSDLTQAEKDWFTTARLTDLILATGPGTPFVVDNVRFNPHEYSLIVRSPQHFGRAIEARELADAEDINDEQLAAGQRAVRSDLGHKLRVMTNHSVELKRRHDLVSTLQREAKTPGFAHVSPERMAELIGVAWNEFQNMLDVVRLERGWDDAKQHRAESALINYLTQGSQRDRVANWQGMINLANQYLYRRIAIFEQRRQEVHGILNPSTDAQ